MRRFAGLRRANSTLLTTAHLNNGVAAGIEQFAGTDIAQMDDLRRASLEIHRQGSIVEGQRIGRVRRRNRWSESRARLVENIKGVNSRCRPAGGMNTSNETKPMEIGSAWATADASKTARTKIMDRFITPPVESADYADSAFFSKLENRNAKLGNRLASRMRRCEKIIQLTTKGTKTPGSPTSIQPQVRNAARLFFAPSPSSRSTAG